MTCCICLQNNCNVITICNHSFCKYCISKIVRDSDGVQYCPLCRKVLNYKYKNNTTTRSISEQNEINFTNRIYKFINDVNKIKIRNDKIQATLVMFDYIQDNLWIKNYEQFDKLLIQIRKKLDHLIYDQKLDVFKKYKV